MTTSIEAVYEGGFFRPTVKVELTEGTYVEVLIPQAAVPRDPKAVASRLAKLARKSSRTDETESTSQNHDEILYGQKARP